MQQDSDRQVREELITDCGWSGHSCQRISRITQDKKTDFLKYSQVFLWPKSCNTIFTMVIPVLWVYDIRRTSSTSGLQQYFLTCPQRQSTQCGSDPNLCQSGRPLLNNKKTWKNNCALILPLSPSNLVFHYSCTRKTLVKQQTEASHVPERQDWCLCQRIWLQPAVVFWAKFFAPVCPHLRPLSGVIMEPQQVEPGREDGATSSWHSWKSPLYMFTVNINHTGPPRSGEEPFNYPF